MSRAQATANVTGAAPTAPKGWALLSIARIVGRRLFGLRARLLLSRPVVGVRSFGLAGVARGATIGHYYRADRNRHGLRDRAGLPEQSTKLRGLPAIFQRQRLERAPMLCDYGVRHRPGHRNHGLLLGGRFAVFHS